MAFEIVPATTKLLRKVEVWLKAEDHAYSTASARLAARWDPDISIPERGFYCNWNIVRSSFERDPDNVHVLLVDGLPVGFADELSILEIHPNHRGRGLGRVLAEHMIARADALGFSVAEIEVAPESALPFWQRMGFTVDRTRRGAGGGIYAYRRFVRRFALGAGPKVGFRVAFHRQSRDWDPAVEPFSVFEGKGEKRNDGTVKLPERAYCFDPDHETSIDSVVSVELEGRRLYEDKVKRPSARAIGLAVDPGDVFFFDHLIPSGATQS